jgi:mono/diheme cytochrome c family protein
MRRIVADLLTLSLLFAATGIGPAWADAGDGRRLALRWCSGCHLVEDRQPGSVPQGPPSCRMVVKSGMSDAALSAFLSHPHGTMPDLALTRAEIDELIQYIRSQRQPPAGGSSSP